MLYLVEDIRCGGYSCLSLDTVDGHSTSTSCNVLICDCSPFLSVWQRHSQVGIQLHVLSGKRFRDRLFAFVVCPFK